MHKFLIAFLLLSSPAIAKIKGNTFSDNNFSISKPADWDFIQNLKNPGIVLNSNKMSAGESGILVAFGKKMGKDFAGVNPAVGVKQLNIPPKTDLVKWLVDEMKRQSANDQYYFQVSPAVAMTIGGNSGAQSAYVNSTVMDGKEFHVYHVLYIVRFSGKTYLINMNCNEGLSQDYVGAFGKISETIEPAKD